MMKKIIAGGAIVLMALFAAPLSASAAGYVPAGDITVSDSTPAPGQAVNVDFAASSFTGGETIGFSVTGEGAVTLAMLKAAPSTVSLSKVAAANGSVTLVVTLPTNASGTYNVTATGATSGNIGTAALTVVAADAGNVLPWTGGEIPFALIWIAAGAVALGLGLLVTISIRRRNHAK